MNSKPLSCAELVTLACGLISTAAGDPEKARAGAATIDVEPNRPWLSLIDEAATISSSPHHHERCDPHRKARRARWASSRTGRGDHG
jgi:hypothetical protein